MGELTAKKDQSLSDWDIRFLVPFWPNRSRNRILKNGRISGQPEPDIRYIPSTNAYSLTDAAFQPWCVQTVCYGSANSAFHPFLVG